VISIPPDRYLRITPTGATLIPQVAAAGDAS
jgi:hypothetical protein